MPELATETGRNWYRVLRMTAGSEAGAAPVLRTLLAIEAEAREQERKRLRDQFYAYWDWLVEQPIYGDGGGWGEAALQKMARLLAEPEDAE